MFPPHLSQLFVSSHTPLKDCVILFPATLSILAKLKKYLTQKYTIILYYLKACLSRDEVSYLQEVINEKDFLSLEGQVWKSWSEVADISERFPPIPIQLGREAPMSCWCVELEVMRKNDSSAMFYVNQIRAFKKDSFFCFSV